MNMQELVDWARREPWLALAALVIVDLTATLIWEVVKRTGAFRVLAGLLLTTVLVAVVLNGLYPPKDGGGKTPPDRTPSETPKTPNPPSLPPSITELISLLEKSRDREEVTTVFNDLGQSEEEPADRGGRTFCFKQHGLEFLFDGSGQLSTICFFSGISDHHRHVAYGGSLPAGLQFVMDRTQVQKQIDKDQGIHVEPEPGKNDWAQYVLRDGTRLYINFGEFDGAERILEVELRKRENLLEQRAALGR